MESQSEEPSSAADSSNAGGAFDDAQTLPASAAGDSPADGLDGETAVSSGPAPSGIYALFDIRREIGRGGMGVVYLAREIALGRWVALKRLTNQFKDDARGRQRFLQEARSAAALEHAHIAKVFSIGEDERGPYISMEYVPGPFAEPAESRIAEYPNPPLSLMKYVRETGTLSVEETAAIGAKLCRALAHAHERGMIHRDITPGNVLLSEEGEPKLVDFGLARSLRSLDPRLTSMGAMLMTPAFGAPELGIDAYNADHRADIFGVGAALFFCLTKLNARKFQERLAPEPLRPILARAMKPNANDRYQSVREMLREFDGLCGTPSAPLAAIASRRQNTLIAPPAAPDAPSAFRARRLGDAARPDPANGGAPGTGAEGEAAAAAGFWKCRRCGATAKEEEGARFCEACGFDSMEMCPNCKKLIRAGSKHCRFCGIDIAAFHMNEELYSEACERQAARQFAGAMELLAPLSQDTSASKWQQAQSNKAISAIDYALKRRAELMDAYAQAVNSGAFDEAIQAKSALAGLIPAPAEDMRLEDQEALRRFDETTKALRRSLRAGLEEAAEAKSLRRWAALSQCAREAFSAEPWTEGAECRGGRMLEKQTEALRKARARFDAKFAAPSEYEDLAASLDSLAAWRDYDGEEAAAAMRGKIASIREELAALWPRFEQHACDLKELERLLELLPSNTAVASEIQSMLSAMRERAMQAAERGSWDAAEEQLREAVEVGRKAGLETGAMAEEWRERQSRIDADLRENAPARFLLAAAAVSILFFCVRALGDAEGAAWTLPCLWAAAGAAIGYAQGRTAQALWGGRALALCLLTAAGWFGAWGASGIPLGVPEDSIAATVIGAPLWAAAASACALFVLGLYLRSDELPRLWPAPVIWMLGLPTAWMAADALAAGGPGLWEWAHRAANRSSLAGEETAAAVMLAAACLIGGSLGGVAMLFPLHARARAARSGANLYAGLGPFAAAVALCWTFYRLSGGGMAQLAAGAAALGGGLAPIRRWAGGMKRAADGEMPGRSSLGRLFASAVGWAAGFAALAAAMRYFFARGADATGALSLGEGILAVGAFGLLALGAHGGIGRSRAAAMLGLAAGYALALTAGDAFRVWEAPPEARAMWLTLPGAGPLLLGSLAAALLIVSPRCRDDEGD